MDHKTQLDELLDVAAASKWLGLSEREVLAKSKGRSPKIAAYWINRRVVRFHPRAILAKMAKDNGVPLDVVAAMFSDLSVSRPTPPPAGAESFPR